MRTLFGSWTVSLLALLGPLPFPSLSEAAPAGEPRLVAKVTASPTPATEDAPIVFTVDIANGGDGAAFGVTVTNRLPRGVTFVRSQPAGLVQAGGQEGEEIVITVGPLAAGAMTTVTIAGLASDVRFDGAEGTIVTNKTIVRAIGLGEPGVYFVPVPIQVRRDFGDVPDPTFPVLRASNGARHRIGNLFLGASVDAEPDGVPTSRADGDDTNGADDEDGVAFLTPFVAGGNATMQVTASLAGVLDVWADFNSDGDWADAGEHAILGAVVPAGPSLLTIPIPAGSAGRCYLRFRLSPGGAPFPVGFINGGEVEDYVVEMIAATKLTRAGTLQVRGENGRIALTWDQPNALLQAAPAGDGPWTTLVDAVSPHPLAADGRHRFFRLIESRNASRSGLNRHTFASRAREADLIVDAVVTDVAYRNSEGDGTNEVSWPHTFVTVRVLDVLKGRVASSNLCLRFLGGLDADGERVMKVSNSTRFDVGERSILFVKRNGFLARPLVGGAEGRLRIADGLVYSERGHRLVLTAAQQLAFGVRDDLAEAQEDLLGAKVVGQVQVLPGGEEPRPERIAGQHLGVADFKTRLAGIIQQNHALADLAAPVLTVSADPTRPFQVSRPRHRPPPPVPAALGPTEAAPGDADEESARVRANDGNPVLSTNP